MGEGGASDAHGDGTGRDAAPVEEAEDRPQSDDQEQDEAPEESEQEIDETVEETFPASDPPAW